MNILLTAATPSEILPATRYLKKSSFLVGNHRLSLAITGIGSLISAYSLTKAISTGRPDYIVQAGIAGSFDGNLSAPQVVIVRTEMLADLGASENKRFTDIFDLRLIKPSDFPFTGNQLVNPLMNGKSEFYGLPLVSGVTVNEISTNEKRIKWLAENHGAAIESMEGAALHYVGLMEGIPFLQVRAISNKVGDRDKKNWLIKEAINSLNEMLMTLLPKL